MNPWPKHPVIYEINTWVWLGELSRKYDRPVTLAAVPPGEWDELSSFGADAVWFMGVWERSPVGTAIANRNPGLVSDFQRALPDFRPADNVGSPYCVRRYAADERLGGRKGLAAARRELARRGLRLILDFVPNHVAPDHPWVVDHPAYLVQGNAGDAVDDPASFFAAGDKVFACGRDPFFPAWPDVLQLNAFNPDLRRAVVETLADIAGQCDGVRCDMAMLLLNQIFERTWGHRAGQRPTAEYWADVIPAVKNTHPGFLFMAEAYWDLEWELQQQGFDYCYDKRLYDRLERDSAENVRLHLCADLAYQEKLVRFIENHDEPRAATAFPGERLRAAAVASLTLPGARLLHEGQFEGRHVRLPVFLGRRPAETPDEKLKEFYRRLLEVVGGGTLKAGEWRLCECRGWPDNSSWRHLVAWCWSRGAERCLVVVNLSAGPAQARLRLPWDPAGSADIILNDVFSGSSCTRGYTETVESGLFVDLPAWGYHVFTLGGRRREPGMIDAAKYDATATLRSGMKVKVRSIRPDDKERLVAAFKNLDPESIYTRFFYHKKMLSEAELKSATELDFEKAVALVVTTADGEQETIIGAGRYAVIEETGQPRSAEVAFTVEEDYHRQGMARILLQHLASIARAKGLSCFVAEVLSQNSGMLTVFSRSGLPMQTQHGGDVVHVTLSLTGERP